jgi:FkbM family methyltransferase
MLSYAQNFEDVILWRALKGVAEGFYVDVGAWHPEIDSVTRHFYETGWRGINVEPNPVYLGLLQKDRPRDINLGVAAGASNGKAFFYAFKESGLSTLDRTLAIGHQSLGLEEVRFSVEVVSLNAIFRRYAPPTVHFLKIDCEGSEKKVINAFNLERFRPWIIVVEATKPNSQERTHEAWEGHLLKSKYKFVYWDGLNRFYLAAEKKSLRPSFSAPPNVFDEFRLARAELEAKALRARIQSLEKQLGRRADSCDDQD